MRSADRGASWAEHPVPGSLGCVHMNIVDLGARGLVAFYRSRWADHVYRSTSRDGVAWTAPVPTPLPNNNSSIQAIRLADGRIAMLFNDSSAADATGRRTGLYDDLDGEAEAPSAAFWGAPRAPMTLAFSADDGLTWPWRRNLETGDGYCMTNNSKDR